MDNASFAHSVPGQPVERWQRLEHHAAQVAALAEGFAARFGSGSWARIAGLLHDVGKADPRFQAYLLRENGLNDSAYNADGQGRVNHSSAGAAWAMELFPGPIGKILAYLVASHHAGLPDWHPEEVAAAALSVRLEEGERNLEPIRRTLTDLLGASLAPPVAAPDSVRRCRQACHLWIRMLFSRLGDADYLDTEGFLDGQKTANRSGRRSWPPAAVPLATCRACSRCRSRPARARPCRRWPLPWIMPGGTGNGHQSRLIPDAMFLYRQAGSGMLCCFLEVDNGSMNTKQMEAKYRRYQAWSESAVGQQYLIDLYRRYGAADPKPKFRVLVVARSRTSNTDLRRVQELSAPITNLPLDLQAKFWFTTVAELRQWQNHPLPLGLVEFVGLPKTTRWRLVHQPGHCKMLTIRRVCGSAECRDI